MSDVTLIGLDLAKQVFQVHGADAGGKKLFNRKLQRGEVRDFFERTPPCLVAMEACASSFHWAREIEAIGHRALILPAQYVKPFVRRGKTDAADAEAIATAARQEGMRFVPIKTAEQQALVVLIKTRTLLTRQRATAMHALRGHMTEFGFVTKVGKDYIKALTAIVRDESDMRLPAVARLALRNICDEIDRLTAALECIEREVTLRSKEDADISRLMTIPGVGPITATTLKAYVPDFSSFKSARHFASWLGLTPIAQSSGGSDRAGAISKQGNPILRWYLVMGAMSVIRHARKSLDMSDWLRTLITRKPFRVAAVAVANKTARIIWALLRNGGVYRQSGEDANLSHP